MLLLIIILIIIGIAIWIYRFYFFSFLIYLSVRLERRLKDFQSYGSKFGLLSALRESLIHERKKKMAGLEMMLSSWERGDEVQPRYEYFEELLSQLKNLVHDERRNLMAVTKDILLWGKLWNMLRRIERVARQKREKSEIGELRTELSRIQNLIDEVVEGASNQFSFTLNQVVSESVKIVRIEKSHLKNIEIQEQLDEAGDTIRFSYDKFKDWQRILTNLIRNAVEAVEAKKAGAGEGTVVADFSLRGGGETGWVKISTQQAISVALPISVSVPVSVCIEDTGIGMDEITISSFYKKGFTFGKEGGLGLGVSEESVQLINQYGNWQVESQKGIGTKITINIDKEKARKAELILPPKKPFLRTKLGYGFSVLVLALIGLTLLFVFDKYSRLWEDWNPAYAEVKQGRQVFMYNSKDQQLWMHEFERPVFIREETPEVKMPLVKIEDLDQDEWNEILVTVGIGVQATAQLFCLDHKGNVLWVFSAGEGFEEGSGRERENTNPEIFDIKNLLVNNFIGDRKKEILIYSERNAFFQSQLAILDNRGHVIGEYWHPGAIPYTIYTDLDGDGKKELVCAGINNRLNWRPIIFRLDIKELMGNKMQGPPYNIFGDVKPAKEKKYVVLPQIKNLDWTWVEASPLPTPKSMNIRSDDIFLMLFDGRHYSLNKDLQYRSCEFRTAQFQVWQKYINFPFEVNFGIDSLNWKNLEIYENGVKVK
jgi:signal transduction histidine kinase